MKKSSCILLLAFSSLALSCSGGNSSSVSSSFANTETSFYQTYTLMFATCGGNSIQSSTHKEGEEIDLSKYVPSRAGYSFISWCKEYDLVTKMGKIGTEITSLKMPKGNLVIYARYKKESTPNHTEEELNKYLAALKTNSEANHFYFHYYRYDNSPSSYEDYDIWAWNMAPSASEGHKFDWVGRTSSSDGFDVTGEATIDSFGGAYIDIDLKATYSSGWDNTNKKFLNKPMSFDGSSKIGIQIVKSSTRKTGGGFWVNDGSNLSVKLDEFALELEDGNKAYHAFVLQDQVQTSLSAKPISSLSSPFDNDDGSNVTYGDSKYDDVNWNKVASKMATSSYFKSLGVGYQIMVSSFADSDGDGFGDIYGISQKLDYLSDLGVKVLWLTPIQLSSSYHGYDISDYTKVDPKFGSKTSPNATDGLVSAESALLDYKDLIEKVHQKGMKVLMDLVLNHTSTNNNWFISSANLDPDYRGFYQWGNHINNKDKINQNNSWYPYGDHPYSYYAKFGSDMPELNYSYMSTREAVYKMTLDWCEFGVDGFRLDAVKHIFMNDEVSSSDGDSLIYDKSASGDYSSDLTKNIHFFNELNYKLKSKYPNSFIVGENFDGHAYHVAPYYSSFDSMFDFYSYFNLTSAAATGRSNSTSKYGTASGFLSNSSTYNVSSDSNARNGKDNLLQTASNSAWNFVDVYKTYNKYRGGTSLPGLFTSNHDIARVINRIAGSGDTSGLSSQGNVNASNYKSLEQSAMCVKIASILFPGITWVYYGDEIGLTGNFPSGVSATSGYADLYYRQPMKWIQGQKVNDGSMATEYNVTGSSKTVKLDEINSSSLVKSASEQMADENSSYSNLKKFISIKNSYPSLITGSFEASNFASGNLAANVLCFTRTLGSQTIKVAVNFNNTEISAYGLKGDILGSYNGATQTKLPAYSAIAVLQK